MRTSHAHKTAVCIKHETQCNIIYASFQTRSRLIDGCAMLNNQRHQIFCDCLLLLICPCDSSLVHDSNARVRVPSSERMCKLNWMKWILLYNFSVCSISRLFAGHLSVALENMYHLYIAGHFLGRSFVAYASSAKHGELRSTSNDNATQKCLFHVTRIDQCAVFFIAKAWHFSVDKVPWVFHRLLFDLTQMHQALLLGLEWITLFLNSINKCLFNGGCNINEWPSLCTEPWCVRIRYTSSAQH